MDTIALTQAIHDTYGPVVVVHADRPLYVTPGRDQRPTITRWEQRRPRPQAVVTVIHIEDLAGHQYEAGRIQLTRRGWLALDPGMAELGRHDQYADAEDAVTSRYMQATHHRSQA